MREEGYSDEELMERFRSSFDHGAFDQLVVRYYRAAVAVAFGLLGRNGLTAEDAVQEAFVKVARARMRFDATKHFAPWFFSILRNVCIDLLRKENRRRVFLRHWTDEGKTEQRFKANHREDLEDMLSVLEPTEREILIYRVVHGMTFREIGIQVGCSEEAAKKRAQRALRRLREHMGERSSRGVPETGGPSRGDSRGQM